MSSEQRYREADNMGTRHLKIEDANLFWMANMSFDIGGFLVYFFNSADHARDALLELPVMHVADDSGEIVCSVVLTYGYYLNSNGRWEGELVGTELTSDLWATAKAAFIKHGGRCKSEREPKVGPSASRGTAGHSAAVRFVRAEKETQPTGLICSYTYYSGPSADAAKEFLKSHLVNQPLQYILVDTPEGRYGRDINGIYKV
jgi:hypothetical protein